MKRKKMLGLLSMALVVSLVAGVGVVVAKGGPYKEPPRTLDVPSDVVWDSTRGEYVLVEELTEDPEVASNAQGPSEEPGNVEYEWYLNHKDSTDAVDQAIVRYIQNPDPASSMSSYWDPDKDAAFQREILSLGIENLPDLLQRVTTDEAFKGLVMEGFARIAKIADLQHVSVADEDVAKWTQGLKKKAVSGMALAAAARDGRARGNTAEDRGRVAKDLGILALPYLAELAKTDPGALDDLRTLTGRQLKNPVDASEDVQLVDSLLDTIVDEY